MRLCFLGDTGDGKTISGVDILKEYYDLKYLVYANIHLKFPYMFTDLINFNDIVNNQAKNIILIDEIGELGKAGSTPMFTFTTMMSQSRKSLGENHHLILTTQTKFQGNPTLRALLDYFIYSEIILKESKKNKFGLQKPLIIKLDWYQKIKRTIPPEFWYSHSTYRWVYETCDLYETYEEAKPLKDMSFIKHLVKYQRFINKKNSIKNLYVLILSQEGLNKTDSKDLARKIIHAKELFPEILKDKEIEIKI